MMQRLTRGVGGFARRSLCTKKPNTGAEAGDTKKADGTGTLFDKLMDNVKPLAKNFDSISKQAADKAKSAAEGFTNAADTAAKSTASGAGPNKAGEGKDKQAPPKSLMDQFKSALDDVKSDLLSDTRSTRADPYEAGKARGLRRDEKAQKTVEVNRDATGVQMHKDSKWYKQWEDFRETNKFVQTLFGMKMKFDESENVVVRGIRSVTERVEESMQGEESELLQVMTSIKRVDPYFNKEEFIVEVEKQIFPGVLEAVFKGDLKTLEKWCNEPSYAVLKSAIEGTDFKTRMTKIVDIGKTDLVTAMFMSDQPVLVFSSRVQTVELERDAKSGVANTKDDDQVNAAYYVLALSKDIERFDSEWEVVELSMQQEGW